MAKHSSCSPTLQDKSTLEPFYIKHSRVEAPYFNVTADWHDVKVDGLSNSKVVKFFYNTESKKAVLLTNFAYFQAEGNLSTTLLVTGEESIFINTSYTLYYKNISITTLFNNYEKISLTDSFSFVEMPAPPTNDHGGSHSADVLAIAAKYPEVKNLLVQMDKHRDVLAMESFPYRSPILAAAFVNHKLCNFS